MKKNVSLKKSFLVFQMGYYNHVLTQKLYLKCNFGINKPIHESHIYNLIFGKDYNLATNGSVYYDYTQMHMKTFQ